MQSHHDCLLHRFWHCGFHLHSRMFDHWFFFTFYDIFCIRHLDISICDGISYIKSMITPSMIARSPSAPVLRSNAFLAIAINALIKRGFTPSRTISGTVLQEHFLVLSKCALRLFYPMDLKIHSLNSSTNSESDQTSQNLLAILS